MIFQVYVRLFLLTLPMLVTKALNAVCSRVKSIKPVFVASPSISTSIIISRAAEEYIMHVMELFVRELTSKAVTLNSYCIPKKKMSLSTVMVSEFPRVMYLYCVLKQTLPVALSVHCQTKVVVLGSVLYTAVNEKEVLGEKTRLQP